MKQNITTVLNICCYTITALVLIFGIWIFSGPDDTSPAGIQYKECVATADALAPDRDTKWMLKKGCMGNYLIHAE